MEEAFQRYNMSVLRAQTSNDEENTLALSLGTVTIAIITLKFRFYYRESAGFFWGILYF